MRDGTSQRRAAARNAAEAALAAARDEARRAQADLAGTVRARGHLRLESPVNGVVAARLAEPGSTVVAGQMVVQVFDPASLWVRARIDQGAPAVSPRGSRRRWPCVHGPASPWPAASNASTCGRFRDRGACRARRIRVAAGERHHRDLAEVTIRLATIEGALRRSRAAVKRAGTGRGVWVLDEGRAIWRPVTVAWRRSTARPRSFPA